MIHSGSLFHAFIAQDYDISILHRWIKYSYEFFNIANNKPIVSSYCLT